jgi:hypothetical protein
LTTEEIAAYEEKLHELLVLLGLDATIADAARATSAKRDDPRAAERLLRYFEDLGRRALHQRHVGLTAD